MTACFSTAAFGQAVVTNLYDVSNFSQDAIESRLSMGGPLFDGWNRTHPNGGDPWVELMGYNRKIERAGSHVEEKNKGTGMTLGYDHVIAKDYRVGMAVSGGYSREKMESLLDTKSRWFGVDIYSTWTGKKVNVIANVGYTHQNSKQRGHLDDVHMDDGHESAINASLRFETSFKTGPVEFVPYYSVRFTHIKGGEYDFKEGGVKTFTAKSSSPNIWQFPVGVETGLSFEAGGWKTRSNLDLAIIPTAGKRKVNWKLIDADSVEGADLRFADSVQYRVGLGIETSKGQHAFGLRYKGGFAAHGSYTHTLSANYQFMY